ncbi:hypothetical protein D9611_013896 [Ephemerocybe angulata]|uniref:Reverse transcriptase domain-containing protein n=1 Tax=Ephemerocybe angulata TaxID=980116 RepID=A0A8H5B9L9_9AGAR|nr:hypothetical protein D9611_013896 [Tulosesus angulatus]
MDSLDLDFASPDGPFSSGSPSSTPYDFNDDDFHAESLTASPGLADDSSLSYESPDIVERASEGYMTLTIASWNVKGDLAVSIKEAVIVEMIKSNSITFFQETGLAPNQDISGHLPIGFEIISHPRPVIPTDDQQWGGVAAVFDSNLSFTYRQDLACPDIIVLEFDDMFVVNAYIPPALSKWWKWSKVLPEVKLAEILATCAGENARKGFVISGDLNGRTGNWQLESASDRYPRTSSDPVVNTRGRWLRNDVCTPHGVLIANGSSLEVNSPGLPTSFQDHGSPTVIDFALVSQSLVTQFVSLAITRPHFSFDHACLQLTLEVPASIHKPEDPSGRENTFSREDCLPQSSSDLDFLLDEVMASSMDDEEATLDFYGPAAEKGSPTNVYIACHGIANGRFRCAIARTSKSIEVITVAGPRANALLCAVGYAALHAPPNQALVFYIDSIPTIRSLCHQIGPAYLRGSLDESLSLARAAYLLIKRTTPTNFIPVNDRIRTLEPWKAAVDAARRSPPVPLVHFSLPDIDDLETMRDSRPGSADQNAGDPPLPLDKPKVTTVLPRLPKPPQKERSLHSLMKDTPRMTMPRDTNPRSNKHRGRLRSRLKKWFNLQMLLHCRTTGEFWKLRRSWTEGRRRALGITIKQAREEFSVRMNPPVVLPRTIDEARFLEDKQRAAEIPDSTVDVTPHGTFSRRYGTQEVIWAKRKVCKRPRKSARGIDNVGYHDLLSISNEKLRDLLSACIEQRKIPSLWTLSTLIALPKPQKPLADPKSYRIIALESCVAKVMTLMIDRRFREYLDDTKLIPDSQNGFREGYRTNNNSFVLRHCIDKARASGKCLITLSINLKNAFPSTNLDTLWTKLHDLGARGPIIDWLREFYRQMTYRVKVGNDYSSAFNSTWGIMAGDSISPALFLLKYNAHVSMARPLFSSPSHRRCLFQTFLLF